MTMPSTRAVVVVTAEQWIDKRSRGMATTIQGRPYIVMTDERTKEPVYQPVVIQERSGAEMDR